MRQIRDEVLDHRHVRQRIDRHIAFDLIITLQAREGIGTVDIHRTATANALAAGTTESQRRIDLVLDLDQRVQNHRPAAVHVDFIGVDTRIAAAIRIVAVDLEGALVRALGGIELARLRDGALR